MDLNKLPNWIERRYNKLLEKFGKKEFTFEEAFKVLKENFEDGEQQVKNILMEIKKAGLLEVKRNMKDKREKIYKLKDFFEVKKINSISTRDELINLLKQAADLIRTQVDYTFILLLLFYKASSDKWQKEYEEKKAELLKDGWEEKEAAREAIEPAYHAFNFPFEYLWENIRKEPQRITEKFSIAMKKLAEENPDYQDIFSQFDFSQFTNNPENNIILNQLVELFSKFSFKDISGDILGDAYEWILKYFAPQKAKEGEVYTPREVIRLMIEILAPEPKKSIYDPALGSAGMLIIGHKYVEEKYGEEKAHTLLLCGQENNAKTLALAKMNMLLHDIRNFRFHLGNTLLFPKFKENGEIKKFDYVIANPPWNQDGYDEETLKKGEYWEKRYRYGFATKQSADWIWIQHMIASAKDEGKIVVVIDTGAVSRGGREKLIRKGIVEDDLIEAVILLPEKLFYNTGAPAVIIVFNKKKPPERKGKILLINASKEYQEGKGQNTLSKENIQKIVNAYQEFKNIEKFAQVVTIEEVKENDYNLSPSRYVSITEEENYRPINEIRADLERLEEEREKVILVGVLFPKAIYSELEIAVGVANTKIRRDFSYWESVFNKIDYFKSNGLFFIYETIPPWEFDKYNINSLMDITYQRILNNFAQKVLLTEMRIVIDDYGIGLRLKYFLNSLKNSGAEIIVENEADEKYLESRVASLIAKYYQMKSLEGIKNNPEFKIEGEEIGSGNAGDERTLNWLKKRWILHKSWPWFVKTSFKTITKIEGKEKIKKKSLPPLNDNLLSSEFREKFYNGNLNISSLAIDCPKCGSVMHSIKLVFIKEVVIAKCINCKIPLEGINSVLRYYCGRVLPDANVILRGFLSKDLEKGKFFENFTILISNIVKSETDTHGGKKEWERLGNFASIGRIKLEEVSYSTENIPQESLRKDEIIIETALKHNAILITADNSMKAFAQTKKLFVIEI